jgi:hypothetical protein
MTPDQIALVDARVDARLKEVCIALSNMAQDVPENRAPALQLVAGAISTVLARKRETPKPVCSVWKSLSAHGACRDCGHSKAAHEKQEAAVAKPDAAGDEMARSKHMVEHYRKLLTVTKNAWLHAAQAALDGDMRALRNRVELAGERVEFIEQSAEFPTKPRDAGTWEPSDAVLNAGAYVLYPDYIARPSQYENLSEAEYDVLIVAKAIRPRIIAEYEAQK